MSSCHSQVQGQEMSARRQAWEALALSERWLRAGLGFQSSGSESVNVSSCSGLCHKVAGWSPEQDTAV